MHRARASLLALLVLGTAALAASCSDADAIAPVGASSSTSAGTGGSGGTGEGGAGGEVSDGRVCVSSPVPAAFAGTSACPAPLPEAEDTFDAALAAGGIGRCDVHLFPEDVALSGWPEEMLVDKRRLPDFTALQEGPLRLPGYARETAKWLDDAAAGATPVSDTIAALAARRGDVLDDACLDLSAQAVDPTDETPLATAVLRITDGADAAAIVEAAKPIPLSLQQKLATVLGAIAVAAGEVEAALGADAPSDARYLSRAYLLYVPSFTSFSTTGESLARLDAVDLARIEGAAAALARVIEEADLAAEPDASFPAFEVPTRLGHVIVHGSDADVYADGHAAEDAVLLFDLGGDDVYEVPAGASDYKHPVSIAIDVRGEDRYGYLVDPDPRDADLLPSDSAGRYHPALPPDQDYGPFTRSSTARQGAGLAGIGLLFDLGAEDDRYMSLALSQGFASTGVGVLYDAGGDDEFAAELASQGMAVFGVAALIDRAGNDVHKSFHLSQGFGGAKGAAALVDAGGNDEHYCDPGNTAEGGHPLYYSPQLPGTGNSSMSQGAAQGRRPLAGDDESYMAGGVGVLRDRAGNDRYTAGVFAQGAGYWQGIGLLLEGDGDDAYDGYWYVQGASAHFALSVFLDQGGSDTYDAELDMAATSIGVGHDFSASLHIDEGGDDVYFAPGLSLGSGNINGVGCFVNVGGDDVYNAKGEPTYGAGNYSGEAPFGEPRQDAPTIGIFADAGGVDAYVVGGVSRALDGTTWSYEPQPYPAPQTVDTERGCGADDGAGSVSLP
jgi:hypothetical protein